MKKIICFIFFLLLGLLWYNTIFCLIIKPGIIELAISPGQVTNGFYTIQNNTSQSITVQIKPETYYGKNVNKWLKIKPISFTLQANEKKDVAYKVNISDDFKDEYCAIIYFTKKSLETNKKNLSGINTRLGCYFYISAKGKEFISLEMSSFQVQYKKKNLLLTLKNNSNVHLRCKYDLEIYNQKGKEIYSKEKAQLPILIPGRERSIAIPLKTNNPFLSGKYYIAIHLYYGNKEPLKNRQNALTFIEVKE